MVEFYAACACRATLANSLKYIAAQNNAAKCPPKYPYIHSKVASPDVIQVVFDGLALCQSVPARALGQAGNTRFDRQVFFSKGAVKRHDFRDFGSRANERYIAQYDIPQIWEFIDTGLSNEIPSARDARIILVVKAEIQVSLTRVVVVVGKTNSRVLEHAAELYNLERAAILSQPRLHEKRRAL
jgi:hypothetical protein